MKPNIIVTIIAVFTAIILQKTGEYNFLSYMSGAVVGCIGILIHALCRKGK